MNRMLLIVVFLLMLQNSLVSGQTMTAHFPGHDLKFDLEALDSLTFEDEYPKIPTHMSMGTDIWPHDMGITVNYCNISAMILDQWNKPVPDGILVEFSVLEGLASVGTGTTGNESLFLQNMPGVANAILMYYGGNVNQEITIVATVFQDSFSFIADTIKYILPNQEPFANIYADTMVCNYFLQDGVFEISTSIQNYQHSWINNELVRFISSAGQFHIDNTPESPVNPEMLTGDVSEYANIERGFARRYLIIPFEEAFPDPAIMQRTVQVDIILPNNLTSELEYEPLILTLTHISED